MKTSIKTMLLVCSVLISAHAIAGQESYGGPAGPHSIPHPLPGAPSWHTLVCGSPHVGNEPLVGESYQVMFTTAAVSPEFSIGKCVLRQRAVAPGAVWHNTVLNPIGQDMETATFGNEGVRASIQKSDYSATIHFGSGAVAECQLN